MWRYAKLWAQPIAEWFLSRPGNAVSATVSPETRKRGARQGFALCARALVQPAVLGQRAFRRCCTKPSRWQPRAMAFRCCRPAPGRSGRDRHRFSRPCPKRCASILRRRWRRPSTACRSAFRARVGNDPPQRLADPLELVLAARATASFPGAFPPLTLPRSTRWPPNRSTTGLPAGRSSARIMPAHVARGTIDEVALIDGAVLVNAPFGAALSRSMAAPASARLTGASSISIRALRAAARSGHPHPRGRLLRRDLRLALHHPARTADPRRSGADRLAIARCRAAQAHRDGPAARYRPGGGKAVRLHLPARPAHAQTARGWRAKAQQAAAERAGYAFGAYASTKRAASSTQLARLILKAAGEPIPMLR
jgi:hypothetical protein